MNALLVADLLAYEAHLPEWLRVHRGRWLLVHRGELAGAYDSRREALDAGYDAYGGAPFLVRQCLEAQAPRHFTRDV